MTLQRITLHGKDALILSARPQKNIVESLLFRTSIIEPLRGRAQFIRTRIVPRERFRLPFLLQPGAATAIYNSLFTNISRPWACPIWTDREALTAPATVGAGTVPVTDTDRTYRQEDGIFFYDIVTGDSEAYPITDITAGVATFTGTLTRTYPVGALVMPLRVGHIRRQVQTSRYAVNVMSFTLEWLSEITPDLRVAPGGIVALGFATLPDPLATTGPPEGSNLLNEDVITNYPILDQLALVQHGSQVTDTYSDSHRREIDGGTGLVAIDSERSFSVVRLGGRILAKNRADAFAIRQLFHTLGGGVPFWRPTYNFDLVPTGITTGTTITVVNNGVSEIPFGEPRAYLHVLFNNGNTADRLIGGQPIDNGDGTADVFVTTPVTIDPATTRSVSYLQFSHLDGDEVTIDHSFSDVDGNDVLFTIASRSINDDPLVGQTPVAPTFVPVPDLLPDGDPGEEDFPCDWVDYINNTAPLPEHWWRMDQFPGTTSTMSGNAVRDFDWGQSAFTIGIGPIVNTVESGTSLIRSVDNFTVPPGLNATFDNPGNGNSLKFKGPSSVAVMNVNAGGGFQTPTPAEHHADFGLIFGTGAFTIHVWARINITDRLLAGEGGDELQPIFGNGNGTNAVVPRSGFMFAYNHRSEEGRNRAITFRRWDEANPDDTATIELIADNAVLNGNLVNDAVTELPNTPPFVESHLFSVTGDGFVFKLFVDAVLRDTAVITPGTALLPIPDMFEMFIGASAGGAGSQFNNCFHSIDDILIYNVGLSDQRIAEDYEEGSCLNGGAAAFVLPAPTIFAFLEVTAPPAGGGTARVRFSSQFGASAVISAPGFTDINIASGDSDGIDITNVIVDTTFTLTVTNTAGNDQTTLLIVIPSALVSAFAHWSFDTDLANSGSSGSRFDLTLRGVGNEPTLQPGVVGAAAIDNDPAENFYGITGTAVDNAQEIFGVVVDNVRTVSAWIHPRGASGNDYFFSMTQAGGSAGAFLSIVWVSDTMVMQFGGDVGGAFGTAWNEIPLLTSRAAQGGRDNSGGAGSETVLVGTHAADTWDHYSFVVDGSAGTSSDVSVYRAGRLVLGPITVVHAAYVNGEVADFSLARFNVGSAFDGLADDFRVNHGPITANDIADIYALGSPVQLSVAPLMHLKLEEIVSGTPDTVTDERGAFDGDVTGTPTVVAGLFGDGLDFGNTVSPATHYIDVQNNGPQVVQGDFAWSFWINVGADALASGRPIDARGLGAAGTAQGVSISGSFNAGNWEPTASLLDDGAGNSAALTTASNVPADDQWHHFLLRYRNSDGQIETYIDGILGDNIVAAALASSDISGTAMRIGAAIDGAQSEAFNGQLDQMLVFNNFLTLADIALLANGPVGYP